MRQRGFTLVEVITVLLIMSLAAVVVLPVMSVLLTRIDDSQGRRNAGAHLHTALDQMVSVAREWPSSNGSLVGMTVYRDLGNLVGLEIPGAGGFRLVGENLMLIDASGREGLLCPRVQSFRVVVTGGIVQAPLTTNDELLNGITVRLELQAGGVRVSGLVFLRSMGGNA